MVPLDAIANEFHDKITSDVPSTPIRANCSPLHVMGQIKIPIAIAAFQTEQVFVVVSKLTVDCLLGADYLTENEVIIDYKLRRVSIKGNEIPFTLTKGVANTIVSTTCTTSVLKKVTIPGCTIQLIDVALPEVVKSRNPSSVLIDPLATAKLP